MEEKGKMERFTVSFPFSSSLLISKLEAECWLNACVSRSEIKISEMVLCSVSILLVTTKCICMYELQNVKCIILVIPHELNVLTYAFKTGIAQLKEPSKTHANNLNF